MILTTRMVLAMDSGNLRSSPVSYLPTDLLMFLRLYLCQSSRPVLFVVVAWEAILGITCKFPYQMFLRKALKMDKI